MYNNAKTCDGFMAHITSSGNLLAGKDFSSSFSCNGEAQTVRDWVDDIASKCCGSGSAESQRSACWLTTAVCKTSSSYTPSTMYNNAKTCDGFMAHITSSGNLLAGKDFSSSFSCNGEAQTVRDWVDDIASKCCGSRSAESQRSACSFDYSHVYKTSSSYTPSTMYNNAKTCDGFMAHITSSGNLLAEGLFHPPSRATVKLRPSATGSTTLRASAADPVPPSHSAARALLTTATCAKHRQATRPQLCNNAKTCDGFMAHITSSGNLLAGKDFSSSFSCNGEAQTVRDWVDDIASKCCGSGSAESQRSACYFDYSHVCKTSSSYTPSTMYNNAKTCDGFMAHMTSSGNLLAGKDFSSSFSCSLVKLRPSATGSTTLRASAADPVPPSHSAARAILTTATCAKHRQATRHQLCTTMQRPVTGSWRTLLQVGISWQGRTFHPPSRATVKLRPSATGSTTLRASAADPVPPSHSAARALLTTATCAKHRQATRPQLCTTMQRPVTGSWRTLLQVGISWQGRTFHPPSRATGSETQTVRDWVDDIASKCGSVPPSHSAARAILTTATCAKYLRATGHTAVMHYDYERNTTTTCDAGMAYHISSQPGAVLTGKDFSSAFPARTKLTASRSPLVVLLRNAAYPISAARLMSNTTTRLQDAFRTIPPTSSTTKDKHAMR